MKKIITPDRVSWSELCQRPSEGGEELSSVVNEIFQAVLKEGDAAVLEYTLRYDGYTPPRLAVATELIKQSAALVSPELQDAITLAANNIRTFHEAQREAIRKIETVPGVSCWRESRPVERVGIYIPGGSAPLFSTVLMLAIPARLAGCKEIVLCTPADSFGSVHPAILFAAQLAGVERLFAIGGIQAIAAMALGTASVPKVDKIFGPGNQYVTAAKTYAQSMGVAIDLPAGPSEVLVIADKTANPAFVAADLLSQAEHGSDSQVMLLSNEECLVDAVISQLLHQLEKLPRKDIATASLNQSCAIVLPTLHECLEFSNCYAPEHLIIATDNAEEWIWRVRNAGSVFLGHYSCESAGDYASGTNHTLPTGGFAQSYSGVSLDSFVKKITFQQITRTGLDTIGPAIELMAEAEGLQAHAEAVRVRINSIQTESSYT